MYCRASLFARVFKVVFLRPVASHAIDYDCTARTWGDAVPSGRGLDRSARTFGFLGIPISIVKDCLHRISGDCQQRPRRGKTREESDPVIFSGLRLHGRCGSGLAHFGSRCRLLQVRCIARSRARLAKSDPSILGKQRENNRFLRVTSAALENFFPASIHMPRNDPGRAPAYEDQSSFTPPSCCSRPPRSCTGRQACL